jgi:hypothetical protein
MSTDLFSYEIKAFAWAMILHRFNDLPSYRHANIKLSNLQRTIRRLNTRLASASGKSTSAKNRQKQRVEARKQVAQEAKLVDQAIKALLEDAIVRDLELEKGIAVKGSRIRSQVQKKYVEWDRGIAQTVQNQLVELDRTFEGVRHVLGGS